MIKLKVGFCIDNNYKGSQNNPIEQSAYDDLQNSFQISSQPTASLTLDEAIARAIKYVTIQD